MGHSQTVLAAVAGRGYASAARREIARGVLQRQKIAACSASTCTRTGRAEKSVSHDPEGEIAETNAVTLGEPMSWSGLTA